jgi:hypothetical protein
MLYGAGEIKSDHMAQWLIRGSTTVESARRYFFVMSRPVKMTLKRKGAFNYCIRGEIKLPDVDSLLAYVAFEKPWIRIHRFE